MINIQIENRNLVKLFEINGEGIYITESIVSTWVVMGILIGLALLVRSRLKSFKEVPSAFQNVIEMMVEAIVNLGKSTLGDKLSFLSGYFFSVFAFILCSNYIGLVGLRPPTSDLATTLPLALTTFGLIHFFGIKNRKGKYFKEYLQPFPVFLPFNILGEFAKPISLSFRLFGNILGGLIIMELMYTMMPLLCRFILPDIGHIFFDVFVGALQAFVFTMLSMTFISLKSAAD